MKKIFNKIIIIIVLLILPLTKASASSSINISCPNEVIQNKTIECRLTGTTDKLISAVSGKITATENIEIIKFTRDTIWQGEGDAKSFDLYTDINKTSNFNIGIISLKIKDNVIFKKETISINNIYYYDDDFNEIPVNNITKDIKILSTNNNLSKLEVLNHNLLPNFNKNILEYNLNTSDDKITIEATSEDEKATVTGTGIKELNYGTNKFIITVTSESGSNKKYILIINRPNQEQPEDIKKEPLEDSKEEVIEETKEEI